jgi:hypothetical protein
MLTAACALGSRAGVLDSSGEVGAGGSAVADAARGPVASALVTGGAPRGLVVGDDRVCWTDTAAGTVQCVAKAGGAPWTVAGGQPGPSGIGLAVRDEPPSAGVLAHDTVYWANEGGGTVMAAPPGGGLVTLASNLAHPRALVASMGPLCGAPLGLLHVSTDGPLVLIALPSGAVTVMADDVGQAVGDGTSGLASDGDTAYAAPAPQVIPPGWILSYAEPAVRGVAIDATSAYFTWGGTIRVASPRTGPKPPGLAILAQGRGTGEGIAVDATHVYWVTVGTSAAGFSDGAVWRVPVHGGPAERVAEAQAHPLAIGVDETAIYWTASGSASTPGAVMKLDKAQLDP